MKSLDMTTRYNIAEAIAQKWTDCCDLKDLERFYFNEQFEYLDGLPDEELLELAKDSEIEL